jgi:hypothetical protein
MVAFIIQDQGVGYAAWVLPTGSAPGGITAEARKVYQQERTFEDPGNKVAWLDSALISPDGSTPYLATSGNSASGKADGFYRTLGEVLTPAGGGMLLAWNMHVSTAYLINPATRTRTTLQLYGVPRVLFVTPPHVTNVDLAW